LVSIAVIVAKFDIELKEWTELNGTKSDQPDQDDLRYAGVIALPPDREMKIQ
jgi:hypothetical protein